MKKIAIGFASTVILLVAVVLIAAASQLSPPEDDLVEADAVTIRETTRGKVIGYVDDNVHVWRGIPYAKPPVDDLRWKAPREAAVWQGVKEVTSRFAVCTQIGGPLGGVGITDFGDPIGSEDCLYLTVRTPAFKPDAMPSRTERLPVMMWIHGGGNSIGMAASYDAKEFVAKYNIIVVTINYRLGPLGWFHHPALHDEQASAEDRSGNYGTLDQIAALQWIQDNIANFGGDPDNVTVYGESAGGRNTFAMIMSPLAKGLLHRAIVQSGAASTTATAQAVNYSDAPTAGHKSSSREIINKLLVANGRVHNRIEAKALQTTMSRGEIRDLLMKTPNHQLVSQYEARAAGMLNIPQMFRDGRVLPAADYRQVFASRAKYNTVPVIMGTNRDEFKIFMSRQPKYVDLYFKLYPVLRDEARFNTYSRYYSDSWKVAGVDTPATLMRRSQGASVYAYRFDWDEGRSYMGIDMAKLIGASHGLEIPFVFNDFSVGVGKLADMVFGEETLTSRIALANTMSSYWAEFAYSGKPGRGRFQKQIEWKPWNNTAGAEKFIVFDTPAQQVRMSGNSLSLSQLQERLAADARIQQPIMRCEIWSNILKWNRSWTLEKYQGLANANCASYPHENFRIF